MAFACSRNSAGKKDATGAFLPEARAWCAEMGADMHELDPSVGAGAMRNRVLAVLQQAERPEAVAFFCHGWATGIQLGFKGAREAQLLGECIAARNPECVLVLYCCSTGQGFARQVAAAMPKGVVWAHETRGHTTRNPMLTYSQGAATTPLWPGLNSQERARFREMLRGPARLRLSRLGLAGLYGLLRGPTTPSDREAAG